MIRRIATTLMTLPLVLTAACATDDSTVGDDDSWTEDGGKADDPSSGGVVNTNANGVVLLDGFNRMLDSQVGKCLEPTASNPAFTVGAIEKSMDLYFVGSKEELAKNLNVNLGLNITYAGSTIGPTVNFVDNFSNKQTAIHLLLATRASYRVTNTRSVALSAQALDWLNTNPAMFLFKCGNLYVNGVEHQAQMFMLIKIVAQTEDATKSIGFDLGLQPAANLLPIGLNANLKSKLEEISKREDVTLETHVLDRGFIADASTGALLAELVGKGISAETFSKIDTVRAAMSKSIAGDVCRDGGVPGEGCAVGQAPGYLNNTTRHAVPTKVDLKAYTRASNSPIGGPGSNYEVMRTTLNNASAYLLGLAKVSGKMQAVLTTEIRNFLHAPPPAQLLYGVAPPAPPLFTVQNMVNLAKQYEAKLDPNGPDSVASRVDTLIRDCWEAAEEGAFSACTANGPVANLAEIGEANALISDYVAKARIVPLRFSPKGSLGWIGANEACAMASLRLPSAGEAERLGVVIGQGNLQRPAEERLKFASWHSSREWCSDTDYPLFTNAPGGEHKTICSQDSWLNPHPATTLCVPASGPFAGLTSLE